MPWYDIFTGGSQETVQAQPTFSESQQYNEGIKAMQYFQDRASQYPNYQYTFDDLLNSIGKDNSGNVNEDIKKIRIQGIGWIALSEKFNELLDDSKIQEAMYNLADLGQGQVPNNWLTYQQAVGRKAMDITFIDAVKYTVEETAQDILTGSQEIGESLMDVGSGLQTTATVFKYAAPVLIFGGIALLVYLYSGQIGSAIKSGTKKVYEDAKAGLKLRRTT